METLHAGTGAVSRGSTLLVFHDWYVCRHTAFVFFGTDDKKTFLIRMMITESPGFIRAAPRWFSVSRYNKALAPYGLLSEMTGQPTVLFNAFTTVILHHKHRICQPPIAFTILEIPISLMRSYSCFLLIAHHLAFQPLHDFLLKP